MNFIETILPELVQGLSVSIPVLVAAFIYISQQRSISKERFMLERKLKEKELHQMDYFSHINSRESERGEKYSPKILEELLYKLSKLEKKIITSSHASNQIDIKKLSDKIDSLVSNSIKPDNNIERKIKVNSDIPEKIISELSHALNTPLSQIEISSSLLLSENNINKDNKNSIQSIINSVDVCKSFLGAYRELIISNSAGVWNPESISIAITSASEVYFLKHKKKIILKVDLPKTIEGYSNNYILAIILPLIENAVEANKENSFIDIKFDQSENANLFTVTNEPVTPPLNNQNIYKDGFTTKEGNLGIGLTSVKHLLSSIQGTNITHSFKNELLTFTITIPRRI